MLIIKTNTKLNRLNIFAIKKIKLFKKEVRNQKNINFKILYLLISIFSCFIKQISTNNKINRYFILCSNDIILKIKGNDQEKVYCEPCPNEVYYINGTQITTNYYFVKLENELNNLILKWDDPVEGMNLFKDWEILEVNFSNFQIKQYMTTMFGNCFYLTSIDFTNLDTSSVESIDFAFANCRSLTSVDLSNLDLSSADEFNGMFNGCESLVYINFPNYKESQVYSEEGYLSIDSKVPWNLVICIEEKSAPILYSSLSQRPCTVIYCGEDWKTHQKKLIDGANDTCVDSCSSTEYKYEYEGTCYQNCPLGTIENGNICETIKNQDDTDQSSIIIITNKITGNHELTESTNIETETKEITESLTNTIINELGSSDISQINNKFESTQLIIDYTEIKNYSQNIINIEENSDIMEYLNKTFIDNLIYETNNDTLKKEMVDNVIYAIKHGFFEEYMLKENKSDIIKETDNEIYQISMLSTQLNNSDNNNSIIILGDCENKLKWSNKIQPNEDLIIFKVAHKNSYFKTQILEYSIFSMNGTQINLDICNNSIVQHIIPVKINEDELYKYNPDDEFYKELCNQYTSNEGTDMTIYDRKNDFNEQNLSLCENNCEFKEYKRDVKKVICDCKIKTLFNIYDKLDKKELFKKFSNYKKIFNIEVIKCYILLFSKNGLIFNLGNYIISFIIFFQIILSIIFFSKGYNLFF